jgi:hypothetical protein
MNNVSRKIGAALLASSALRMQRSWATGAGWADNWTGGLFSITAGGSTKWYVQYPA